MEATELRIGNIVNFKKIDDNFCIEKGNNIITENIFQQLLMYETVIKAIEPIPLTEDWFWKFKFLKEESLIVNEGWIFEKPDFGGFYRENNYWLPKPYYFSEAFGEGYKLKYVHQLQNLYYALTGKELTDG